MEGKRKITFKTYLGAWFAFTVGTIVMTLAGQMGIGMCIGIIHQNAQMGDLIQIAQTTGMITVFPVFGVSSLTNYCFFTWFFFLRK